jgi:hypothetical protein
MFKSIDVQNFEPPTRLCRLVKKVSTPTISFSAGGEFVSTVKIVLANQIVGSHTIKLYAGQMALVPT